MRAPVHITLGNLIVAIHFLRCGDEGENANGGGKAEVHGWSLG
jgi:hypothetical protein